MLHSSHFLIKTLLSSFKCRKDEMPNEYSQFNENVVALNADAFGHGYGRTFEPRFWEELSIYCPISNNFALRVNVTSGNGSISSFSHCIHWLQHHLTGKAQCMQLALFSTRLKIAFYIQMKPSSSLIFAAIETRLNVKFTQCIKVNPLFLL